MLACLAGSPAVGVGGTSEEPLVLEGEVAVLGPVDDDEQREGDDDDEEGGHDDDGDHQVGLRRGFAFDQRLKRFLFFNILWVGGVSYTKKYN